MPKEQPIKVTFLFHDDEQFHHFLEDNKIDVYTYNWKKHEYIVDLSTDVNKSIADAVQQQQPATSSGSVNEFI